jgi:hypothetical protein
MKSPGGPFRAREDVVRHNVTVKLNKPRGPSVFNLRCVHVEFGMNRIDMPGQNSCGRGLFAVFALHAGSSGIAAAVVALKVGPVSPKMAE